MQALRYCGYKVWLINGVSGFKNTYNIMYSQYRITSSINITESRVRSKLCCFPRGAHPGRSRGHPTLSGLLESGEGDLYKEQGKWEWIAVSLNLKCVTWSSVALCLYLDVGTVHSRWDTDRSRKNGQVSHMPALNPLTHSLSHSCFCHLL